MVWFVELSRVEKGFCLNATSQYFDHKLIPSRYILSCKAVSVGESTVIDLYRQQTT